MILEDLFLVHEVLRCGVLISALFLLCTSPLVDRRLVLALESEVAHPLSLFRIESLASCRRLAGALAVPLCGPEVVEVIALLSDDCLMRLGERHVL